MLRIDAAPRRRLEHLVRGHRQHAGGRRPAARHRRRRRAATSGATRPTVERTVAVLVRLPGGTGPAAGRLRPRPDRRRSTASPAAIADGLRAYAAEGIAHVQLVLDPITVDSIRRSRPSSASSIAADGGRCGVRATSVRVCGPRERVLASGPRCEIRIDSPRGRAGRRAPRHRLVALAHGACGGGPPSAGTARPPTPDARRPSPTRRPRHLRRARDRRRRLPGAQRRRTRRSSPSNAGAGGQGHGLVKRIDATYADWPLIDQPVPVGRGPGQGDRLEDRHEAGPGRGAGRVHGPQHPRRVGTDDRRAGPKKPERDRQRPR